MVTQLYPGNGLTLPQLVFALNEELKCTVYAPSYVAEDHRLSRNDMYTDSLFSFTSDQVSQLDQDTSIALATIREWRNSFIPINRIPFDVFSLIPTHLSSQKDRLHVSSVCRHWRRTFLRRAELWSKLFLSNGEDYVKTFLERAKGSELDIIIDRDVPVHTMALLSSNTRQMRSLDFLCANWMDIQKFSQVNSEPLPLLHTLTIDTAYPDSFDGTTPQHLFSNAVNLRMLRFYSRSRSSPSFLRFDFPNLVSFEFSAKPSLNQEFRAPRLLDFLEASPTLRTVFVTIIGHISFQDFSRERIITLPNVEDFSLITSDGGHGYELAAHISCPSARLASLVHKRTDAYAVPEEASIFPSPTLWKAIVRQYTRSPVEEVKIELKVTAAIFCQLAFRSGDGTLIELCFKGVKENEDGFYLPSQEMQNKVLAQSTTTVQNHPHLANLKCLWVRHSFDSVCFPEESHVANEIGRLFKSLGPLDELTIHHCDLRPYCRSIFNFLGDRADESVVFPPTKQLVISHPTYLSDEYCKVLIMGLAESQHARGIPFERVIIRRESMSEEIEEELRPWVGSVEYCYELCESDDD